MKKSIQLLVIFLMLFSACSPKVQHLTTAPNLPLNQTYQDEKRGKQRTNLIGICDRKGLQAAPFKEWYDKYYNDYTPFAPAIKKGKKNLKGVEVLTFMGSWCGDSKRGVPQFYKVMDEMGFDEKNMKLVCVSDQSEKYKQSPNGEEQGLNIHRVPTFIFYKEGKEIGRIIEKPVTSFDVDIAQILNGLAPTPKYATQILIHHHLQEKGIDAMEVKLENYGRYVARYTYSSSELNSYGYVLLGNKKYDEAILIFKINAAAYPHNPNVFDSLAEAYLKNGNKTLAIENYKKVLELSPDHENAKTELEKLGITNFSMTR